MIASITTSGTPRIRRTVAAVWRASWRRPSRTPASRRSRFQSGSRCSGSAVRRSARRRRTPCPPSRHRPRSAPAPGPPGAAENLDQRIGQADGAASRPGLGGLVLAPGLLPLAGSSPPSGRTGCRRSRARTWAEAGSSGCGRIPRRGRRLPSAARALPLAEARAPGRRPNARCCGRPAASAEARAV